MAASLASQDWDMLPAEGPVQAEEATLDKKQAIQRLQECILATVGRLAVSATAFWRFTRRMLMVCWSTEDQLPAGQQLQQ